MTRRFIACAIVLAALGAVSMAQAQPAAAFPTRRMGVRWEAGAPLVTFSARDLANRMVRHELVDGTRKTLVMRVMAFTDDGRPVAVALRSCQIRYDIWPEIYWVTVLEANVDRTLRFRNDLEAVLERCLVARRFPVGTADDYRELAGRTIYFAVLLEFEPISAEEVRRLRRWLARSDGAGSGDAFYGSFVSVFVNRRIGEARRTRTFRSQLVTVPP